MIAAIVLSSCDLNSFPADPLPTVPPSVQEDITLLKSLSPYYMSGYSVIQPGVTLTIEPGTQIIADHQNCRRDEFGSCATLIVSKGGYLIAEGTPEEPISLYLREQSEPAETGAAL